MPFTVVLTGGIGSGKSAVTDLFAARGAAVVDTDVIAHALTGPGAPGSRALADAFGADYLGADGALDRRKMRERAFGDPAAKGRLEAILHPMIRAEAEVRAQTAAATASPYVVVVVPLLTATSTYAQRADRVLVVDCPEALQVTRVMQRSRLTEPEVRAIMATQATRAARLAMADDVITNDGPREALVPQVDALHARFCTLAHAKKPR